MNRVESEKLRWESVAFHVMRFLFAGGLLTIWSMLIAAWVKREYHLMLPQWVLVPPAGVALTAVLYAVGRGIRAAMRHEATTIFMMFVFLPPLGIVFGSIYSGLVRKYVNERSWASAGWLSLGLGITIFGFGLATHTEFRHLLAVFLPATGAVLAFRWLMGISPLGFVSFGVIHIFALSGAMVVAISDAQRKRLMTAIPEARVELQPQSSEAAGK